jgi:hypothetical protein
MYIIENALNSAKAGAYKVNKHALLPHLVMEFLELGVPGYRVKAALELTFIRQHATAHQHAGHNTYLFSKVQDRKHFCEDVSGLTHLGAKVLIVMTFSGQVS